MKGKRFALFLAAGFLAGALSGCAQSGQSGEEIEKVRLLVWSPAEDQSKESGQWL